MGDVTIENPQNSFCRAVANGARAPAACQSRCLSLTAQPAENSLKMLVNALVLFTCDSDSSNASCSVEATVADGGKLG